MKNEMERGVLTDGVRFLPAIIGNQISRRALSRMNHFCERCSKSRLEVALELYAGSREAACPACTLARLPLTAVMAVGSRALGVDEEVIKRTLSDPHWRRGLISVIEGITAFGVRRPFTPGAPFQVVWDVTYACNLRCQHCYASAGKPLDDELSTAEALDLIDRLADLGVIIVAFSGGEPLVRGDILQLASYARQRGIYVAVATNGTMLTRGRTTELREAGVEYLQISLDGADAETHDSFRGMPGCFDRTVEGIRNAVADGFFVNISTTVTRHNLDQVPEIIDLSNELGANWFMAYNFIPAGRGKDIVRNDLTPEMREDLLRMLYEKNKTSKCQLLSTAPQYSRVALQQCSGGTMMVPTHFYNQTVDRGMLGLAEFIGGCGAGRFYMAIRANGDIDPCVFFHRTVGNVRTDDLRAVWLGDRMFNALRDRDALKDNCGHCDYRYFCGGCRARANGYLDDPLAADPGCVRNAALHDGLVAEALHQEGQEIVLPGR